jgi:outer membrane cobalamin receptor
MGGRDGRSTYHKLRSVEATPGGPATVNTESGGGRAHHARGDLSAKLTYDIDARTNLSAKVWGGGGGTITADDAQFRGLTPDFRSFAEHRRLNTHGEFYVGEFNFDHKGLKDGETLKASTQVFGNPIWRQRTSSSFSNGGSLSITQRNHWLFDRSQVDWDHPMRKGQILSIGGSWDIQDTTQFYRFDSVGGDGSLGPDSVDQYHALSNTFAAYATFQQPVGKWTVMPGLRFETNSRRITSPGLPDVRVEHGDLFPTLHVQHALSKTLNLTLSYSKRIDRAPVQWLRPYSSVENIISISEGNPHLKDQSVDAYEANLHFHKNKVDAGLIVYDRETSRLWMQNYSVRPGGASIYAFINAGHRRDSGAEFDLSMPIAHRVKATVSVNLFDERGPVGSIDAPRTQKMFRYTSNGTLEWDGPNKGKTPGDVAQLQWIYNGRARDFQFEAFSWNRLTLSYTHSFDPSLSLTGTFIRSAPLRHNLEAPLVQELYREHPPVEFKLKLLKTFGNPK